VVLNFGIFEGAAKERPVFVRLRGAAMGGVRGRSLSLSLLVAWLESLLLAMMEGLRCCALEMLTVVLCVESVGNGVSGRKLKDSKR
jgi:hypothetical protein